MQEFRENAHINLQKEYFSYAYISQVSSAIGYECQTTLSIRDNTGIDLSITVPGLLDACLSPQIQAQVKCTSKKCIKEDFLSYNNLPVQTYRRLISPNTMIPQILIVVVVSEDPNDWVEINQLTEIETTVKTAAFWISLKNKKPVNNKTTVTVKIPIKNRLTPEVLREIMRKVAQKE